MIARARNALVMVCIAFVASSCASVSESATPTTTPSAETPADRDATSQWSVAGLGASLPTAPVGGRDPAVFGPAPAELGVERPRIDVRTGDTLDERADVADRPEPRSITIAGLDITAPVRPAGIDDRGEFDLPPGDEAGWYRFGPTPGQDGSAVIAAHVDWNGVPGAFFELRDARPGQQVVVDFDDDSTATFRIVEVRQYDKTALPLDELFVRSGDPQLALITCGGDFDSATRSYEDNVVVVAEPV